MNHVDESCITLDPDYKRITSSEQLDDNGVIALCAEMFFLMREDYMASVRYMATHHVIESKRYAMANKTKMEIETFMHSPFFHSMFDIDGRVFLKMLLEKSAG